MCPYNRGKHTSPLKMVFTDSDMDTPMKDMLRMAGPFMGDGEFEKVQKVVNAWLKVAGYSDDDSDAGYDDAGLGKFLENTSITHGAIVRFLMELDRDSYDLDAPLRDFISDYYPDYKGDSLIEMYASDDIESLGNKFFEHPPGKV